MKNKKALITGIAGQDGSYLSEYLLSLNYDVFGIVRRNSVAENQDKRINHLINDITVFYGDVSDIHSLYNIFKEVNPDEIYNLAAQSHVMISHKVPNFTLQTNGLGVANVLEAYKNTCPEAKLYQASSSEMFGNNVGIDGYQSIDTPMHPTSPYGCAKVLGYNLVRHYRRAYNLHVCNGILFNHESPRRGSNFVTGKIVKSAVEIAKSRRAFLSLGNLDSYRDWGHSKDYVRAMHMIVNFDEPSDYIVATGETHSVREVCEYVFGALGIDYNHYIKIDERYFRPQELQYLKGDARLIRAMGWEPTYTFESLLDEMIEYWMKEIGK